MEIVSTNSKNLFIKAKFKKFSGNLSNNYFSKNCFSKNLKYFFENYSFQNYMKNIFEKVFKNCLRILKKFKKISNFLKKLFINLFKKFPEIFLKKQTFKIFLKISIFFNFPKICQNILQIFLKNIQMFSKKFSKLKENQTIFKNCLQIIFSK